MLRRYLSKSLWLLAFTLVICCVLYTAVLWAIGQTVFPFQANGSVIKGSDGQLIGSLLIAQPFSKDEYFQPRPSAASYDASASTSSAYAASNPALRGRVAATLGPIVKYKSGPKAGQLVAPDIEAWFQKDRFDGNAHIVAQWADLHGSLAQAWVKADPNYAAYVDTWSKAHQDAVAKFVKDNPGTPQPQAADLAVVFFEAFSKDHPGKFPSVVTPPTPATAPATPAASTLSPASSPNSAPAAVIAPVGEGADIQSNFFDMWRQDHSDLALADVPGDMVTTSASGLDPHITLENAMFQLDRVAAKWAADTRRDPSAVRKEIEQILQEKSFAPLDGLVGERIVNVLEVNLELRSRFGPPS